MSETSHIYEFGPFRLDPVEHLLLRDGRPVPLKPRVLKLLLVLIQNAGRVLEKEELMKDVWSDRFVEESNLTVSIFALRKALGENRNELQYIETVPRHGYRFVATVKEVEHGNGRPQPEALVGPQAFSAGNNAIVSAGNTSAEEIAIGTSESSKSRVSVKAQVVTLAMLVVALTLYGTYKLLARKQSLPSSVVPFQKLRLTKITNTGNVKDAVITPDGKYVVYEKEEAGQQSLWVRQVGTTSNVQTVAPTDTQYSGLTVSRDGNNVYYLRTAQNSTYTLYRMPILGGASTEIVSRIDSRVALSPDGKRIAFVRWDRNQLTSILFAANADGSGEQALATRKSPDFFSNSRPAWSPDGKIIACVAGSYTAGLKMNMVEVQAGNGDEHLITSGNPAYIGDMVWLADGTGLIIVGTNQRTIRSSHIWHISHPGGEVREITNDLSDYNRISQTTDSTALAAVQTNLLSSIWTITPEKEGSERQVTSGTYAGDGGLAWMPDGRIVYTSNLDGNEDIWIMNADGSGRKQLTSDGHSRYPTIASDENTIVFVSYRDGAPHIWKMNADGRNQQQLTNGFGETSPHCSPDGKFVVYQVFASDTRGLWKIPINGGVAAKLAGGQLRLPGVSPDGKQIAYYFLDKQSGARWRVGVMPFQGGEPTRVFDLPPGVDPNLIAPIRWTPDGRALTYISQAQAISGVWSLPLDGTKPKRLAAFKDEQIFWYDWSRDGKQLLCARGREISDAVLIEDLKN